MAVPKYLNRFKRPEYVEETIEDQDGDIVGTVRVKPSSVQWRPKHGHRFYTVTLEQFASWITGESSGAKLRER